MRTDISKINEKTPHQGLTEGLMLFAGGTSKQFNTGEWRTNTPVFDKELIIIFLKITFSKKSPLFHRKRISFIKIYRSVIIIYFSENNLII